MVQSMKLWTLCLLLSTMCVSCQQQKTEPANYTQASSVSKNTGEPTDSLAYYVPTTIRKDTQVVQLDIDQMSLEQFSTGLYYAKEPILYNYYLGHDIYRFSLLRDFKMPIYVILHKDGGKVWLTVTALDRSPNMAPPPQKFVGDWKTGRWVQVTHDEFGDTIVKNARGTYTRRANIAYTTTIQLTEQDWTEFEKLLQEADYWNMTPFDSEDHLDSERWLIEAHLKNKYWFVHLYSPKGGFYNAGNFLLEKSGIKNQPIFSAKKAK